MGLFAAVGLFILNEKAAWQIDSDIGYEDSGNLLMPHTILLPIRSVARLLDNAESSLEGTHFQADAAKLLWEKAWKAPKSDSILLKFVVPNEETGREKEIRDSLANHLERRERCLKEDLSNTLREGWSNLLVGLFVVVILLGAAEAISHLGHLRTVSAISESFVIMAWVVLWRPAELLLYSHFPIRRDLRLVKKLQSAPVTFGTKID